MGPPKSWTTSVRFLSPSASMSRARFLAWSSGRYDQAAGRSLRPKPRWSGATRPQLVHVARRNGAAHDHRDVAGAVVPQPVEHATGEEQMGAGQHRQPDDVHVLLDRRLHDLVRRPLESGVDHLDAGVAQGVGHDFRAAVVPVEPWLGDQHLHASRNAGSQRALPPGSSATRRGESRTALPIATFAGSTSTRIENTRRPSIFTIANTRGPWKPAGSPVSCTVNAWTV